MPLRRRDDDLEEYEHEDQSGAGRPRVCWLAALTVAPARAGYDVIVPSEIEYGTQGNVGRGIGYWGWVIAGDETLAAGDFSSAILTIQVRRRSQGP
jgi:hypothetical protein